MSSDPTRLLERADLPDLERSLLDAGRSGAPVDYDVNAGVARFRTQLAALAAAGAATAAAGAATTPGASATGKLLVTKVLLKGLTWLAVGAAFAGAGLVAGIHVARSSPDRTPIAAHPKDEPAPAPERRQPSAVAPPAAPEAVPSVDLSSLPQVTPQGVAQAERGHHGHAAPERTRPTTPAGPRDPGGAGATGDSFAGRSNPAQAAAPAPAAPVVTAPASAAPPEPPAPAPDVPAPPPPAQPAAMSEIRAVALARSLVDRDPGAAIALLDKTQHDHPNGYFLEERQALRVLALARDGQRDAARRGAAAFLRAYPNGPYSDRVRAVTSE